MTTYNTYQEAKIANPESEIVTTAPNWDGDREHVGKFESISEDYLQGAHALGDESWVICKPSDHCMTVEKFLADGHKLEIDDVIFGEDEDDVDVVSSDLHCRSFNMPVDADRNIYILRAAALEKIPTETPEEKEVLDGIESAGEAEWKNGDECVYMNSKIIHVVIGRDDKYRDSFWCKSPCGNINLLDTACLLKPETPPHREERERLEAAEDLYYAYMSHWDFKPDWEVLDETNRNAFLTIVDKTKYRKEKAHGAN